MGTNCTAEELIIYQKKKIESLEAERQTCKEGHHFIANSHEYPCPRCETGKLEAEVERLDKGWAEVNKRNLLEALRLASLVEQAEADNAKLRKEIYLEVANTLHTAYGDNKVSQMYRKKALKEDADE